MEVLVALGIFALGFVAIASVFPVGIALQRQTTNAVLARHVGQNAEALLTARALDQAALGVETGDSGMTEYFNVANQAGDEYPDYATSKMPLPTVSKGNYEDRVKGLEWADPAAPTNPLLNRWSLIDRSSPSVVNNTANRDQFWVPLIRHTSGDAGQADAWNLFVFVLDNTDDDYGTTNYPLPDTTAPHTYGIANRGDGGAGSRVPAVLWVAVADQNNPANSINGSTVQLAHNSLLSAGDLVLDSNGIEYTVLDASGPSMTLSFAILGEPEYFWFVRPAPGESGSPLLDIHGPFEFTPAP